MDEEILKQIFDELFSYLEPLDAQNSALLQLVKAKSIATDKELGLLMEEAGSASNVKWLAVRVRTAALISSALRPPEKPVEVPTTESAQPAKSEEKVKSEEKTSGDATQSETAQPLQTVRSEENTGSSGPEVESKESQENKSHEKESQEQAA